MVVDHPDQSRLTDSLHSSITSEENAKNRAFISKVGHEVGAEMDKHGLDAIAILSDSPITSIAAAAGTSIEAI